MILIVSADAVFSCFPVARRLGQKPHIRSSSDIMRATSRSHPASAHVFRRLQQRYSTHQVVPAGIYHSGITGTGRPVDARRGEPSHARSASHADRRDIAAISSASGASRGQPGLRVGHGATERDGQLSVAGRRSGPQQVSAAYDIRRRNLAASRSGASVRILKERLVADKTATGPPATRAPRSGAIQRMLVPANRSTRSYRRLLPCPSAEPRVAGKAHRRAAQ